MQQIFISNWCYFRLYLMNANFNWHNMQNVIFEQFHLSISPVLCFKTIWQIYGGHKVYEKLNNYISFLPHTRLLNVVCYTSVTRFGEISPLWQNFKILWQFLWGSFRIWKNEPTLANAFKANFFSCKWSNCIKMIKPYGHTGLSTTPLR